LGRPVSYSVSSSTSYSSSISIVIGLVEAFFLNSVAVVGRYYFSGLAKDGSVAALFYIFD
jgi:hypothetical protein